MLPQEVGATEWLANLTPATVIVVALSLTVLRAFLVSGHQWRRHGFTDMLDAVILAGMLVFLIIRPFVVQAFFIPTESMEPTLQGHNDGVSAGGVLYHGTVHDHIFVDKLAYRFHAPRRGDIIVFRAERKADATGGQVAENTLVKRLIGIPGDTIDIHIDDDGFAHVFRNGKRLREPYTREPMEYKEDAVYGCRGPLKLGPNELFVLGDNRNNSNDSRFWGTLPANRILGKAALVFWPLSRAGRVR